jgi:uncharacterized membrane protein/protein-disulfide isomerase
MSGPGIRRTWFDCLSAAIVSLTPFSPVRIAPAQTGAPAVHAVLFHSPKCSYCAEIIEQELPPLIRTYGSRLDILQINIETPEGLSLYQAALEEYGVTGGIPVLFLDDTVLNGRAIPEQLPDLVDTYLQQGGADWPAIPGLAAYRQSLPDTIAAPPTATPFPPTPTFAAPSTAEDLGGGAGGAVRVLLFFSPTCHYCGIVQDDVLPSLQEEYREQIIVVEADTSTEWGYALYQSTCGFFGIQRPGVPFLVIGTQYIVGSTKIREQLPSLVEQAFARGGVDWPAVPGLREFLDAPAEDSGNPNPGIFEQIRTNLARDPVANAVSVIVLLGMLVSAAASVVYFRRIPVALPSGFPDGAVPAMCCAGLAVALYLSYVEIGRVEAVCGPVGDCNTVQQSTYARLFGILPIGVLGVAGYILILFAWLVKKKSWGNLKTAAALTLFGLSTFGFFFSIYLTFLEPFVIGASCSWCLASAVLMTGLFWLSLHPVKAALYPPAPDPG